MQITMEAAGIEATMEACGWHWVNGGGYAQPDDGEPIPVTVGGAAVEITVCAVCRVALESRLHTVLMAGGLTAEETGYADAADQAAQLQEQPAEIEDDAADEDDEAETDEETPVPEPQPATSPEQVRAEVADKRPVEGSGSEPTDKEIREWAKVHDKPVPKRGRIPAQLRAEFLAAHS